MTNKSTYAPRSKTAAILERAFELVHSVPYQVSARWLFYGLFQEGHYSQKEDYKNKFLPAVSSARHAFYRQWRPDTLADDTRAAVVRGDGFDTPGCWVAAVQTGLKCELSKWYTQEYYVELWFEARAMLGQFRHYTSHITLRPMGGQPSIPYKWATAKALEGAAARYGKPVVVLYFGDLDHAGGTIADVVKHDVGKWCGVPFQFQHCGLTGDQVNRYDVPENFEKPGTYQWEALSDEAARDIITAGTEPFISQDLFSTICDQESATTEWLQGELAHLELPEALNGNGQR